MKFSVLLCVLIFLFSGCSRNKEIKFDDSYPLATVPDVEWAVVVDPYAAYRKEFSWNSDVVGHCRKGDILQILGSSVNDEQENWFFFSEGWLPSSSVNVYSNRLKAQTAARLIKGNSK